MTCIQYCGIIQNNFTTLNIFSLCLFFLLLKNVAPRTFKITCVANSFSLHYISFSVVLEGFSIKKERQIGRYYQWQKEDKVTFTISLGGHGLHLKATTKITID